MQLSAHAAITTAEFSVASALFAQQESLMLGEFGSHMVGVPVAVHLVLRSGAQAVKLVVVGQVHGVYC